MTSGMKRKTITIIGNDNEKFKWRYNTKKLWTHDWNQKIVDINQSVKKTQLKQMQGKQKREKRDQQQYNYAKVITGNANLELKW